ncbi:glycosyltransferase 87 family protein [Dactylosporangium sp. NBC_01737]|uniref:glycosyltransferase 87 family protein n=1 Tax=Dactylosporangium sp. NBC_01737 TaxID=2975959 RepID=UPI002E133C12|nr:glycosyltransferase 87 family protein [Dactylosporangium sp. NBC_01737]
MTARRAAAIGCLAAMLAALAFLPGRWYLLMWVPFAAGAYLVCRLDRRTALVLVLLGGAALPLTAGLEPPNSSDDMYRYVWDGRVQRAGIDPYAYAPSAPELAGLRDDFLWPDASNWCVPGGCTLINRPDVPTIYPPVAEALFAAVPDGGRQRPMQLTMAAFAFATGVLLWYALRRLGRDPRRAVLWAWCPLVALEAGNNAHVDVVAVALAAAALYVLARAPDRRAAVLGGLLLGLAVATKLTPALLGPAVLRRRPVTVGLAAAGAVAAVYLPHVLAAGPAVLGYLPGYLHEEGYSNGSRFALLSLLLPAPVVAPAAVLLLAAAALYVLRTAEADRPWRGAAVMVAAALLVTAPAYPWYALLLVMLVAYGAPAEWLALALAGTLTQLATDLGLAQSAVQRAAYAAALLVMAAGLLLRRRRGATGIGSWDAYRGAAAADRPVAADRRTGTTSRGPRV